MKAILLIIAVLMSATLSFGQNQNTEQMTALNILLNNLGNIEKLESSMGHVFPLTASEYLTEALTQGEKGVKVDEACEYVGRSLIRECQVTIYPASIDLENPIMGKHFSFSFSSVRGVIVSDTVKLDILL